MLPVLLTEVTSGGLLAGRKAERFAMANGCSGVSPGLHPTLSFWDLAPQLENETELAGSTQELHGMEGIEFLV